MLRLTPSVEEIRAAFQQFSQDPMERFRVKLRRKRAEQIRELLSNPQAVDVDTFNREVWVLKTEVRLSGKELKDDLFADKPGAVTPAELEAALEAGELDYKGNSIWGSATQIFG
ncbi:MAG TPA: hypothetical protein VHR86_09365, partial [Armatimonadota bacterium]|nr:hypothetical protein [Armatimonadota bacterium]